MMRMISILTLAAALAIAPPATAQQLAPAIIADPAPDALHPARMEAFVIASHGANLNAVLYIAAGAGPHPTLLLLHGFPGNEQNLDLAQAARRDGWNVLTFHYRGSWGSGGSYSFVHCEEDAAAAVAFLRDPANAAKFGIDPKRIAVAGHSLGGMVAARTVADDPKVLGAFLIDPADFAAIGRSFSDPRERAGFLEGEVRGDMPPLSGTSEAAIMAETAAALPALDLVATAPALAGRPLEIVGATRGIAMFGSALAAAATKAGAKQLHTETWATDHSFSDHRIALADLLVRWLDGLPKT
jgi:pimeloyl-ACP methyl ester carboxylesterase